MSKIIRPNFRAGAHVPRRDLPDRKAPIVRDSEYGERETCSHEYIEEQNVKARIKRAGGTVPHPWELDQRVRDRRKGS